MLLNSGYSGAVICDWQHCVCNVGIRSACPFWSCVSLFSLDAKLELCCSLIVQYEKNNMKHHKLIYILQQVGSSIELLVCELGVDAKLELSCSLIVRIILSLCRGRIKHNGSYLWVRCWPTVYYTLISSLRKRDSEIHIPNILAFLRLLYVLKSCFIFDS